MKDDSRKVLEGDTFISLTDNKKYILEAINNGASKIITNKPFIENICVLDTRKYLTDYLDNKYKEKFKKIKLIGITGTNGKTTSSYILWQILNKLGYKCGYIGTIGFYIDKKIKDLNNTTPDILDLYEMIDMCIDLGCTYLVMEVSSQALSYKRIGNLKYEYAIFTNLTEEHLDYHKTMDEYAMAKQELFRHTKKAIINKDSNYFEYFTLNENENYTYGFNGDNYKIENYNPYDMVFFLNGNYYKTNLIGKHNMYNLITSIIILDLENIKYDKKILEDLKYPKGRMEVIEYKSNKIIIDYAHTPDGILNILNSVRKLKPRNIITVLGAGGNRDTSKRDKMGYIATSKSDYVIFTDDNPRYEDEMKIINDIIQKIDTFNYEIITNREKAIIRGIQKLEENDILLVLGKGHEDYQIIKGKKMHFSDQEVVLKYIKE